MSTISEATYQKHFNEGYELEKHMPELAEAIAKAFGEMGKENGFEDGRKRVQFEKETDKQMSWNEQRLTPQPDKDRGRNIEPER